jgi:hypothetical protein
MILYDLRCSQGHQFEAWFKDSGTYDKQAKRGDIECPVCSDTAVEKAIMAPRLSSSTRKKGLEHDMPKPLERRNHERRGGKEEGRASEVAREILDAVGKVQKHVEENAVFTAKPRLLKLRISPKKIFRSAAFLGKDANRLKSFI